MTRWLHSPPGSTRTTSTGSVAGLRLAAGRLRAAATTVAFVAGFLAAASTAAQTTAPATPASPKQAAPVAQGGEKAAPGRHSPYRPDRFAGRAGTYYRLVWGVDSLGVKWAESGEVIRFTYRVLDAAKAKALNDKKFEPSLIDPQAGVKLVVPSMENVGQLRQTAAPEEGKAYWIVFSNKGRLVKRGHHVNVVIGAFHADGLVVD